MLRAIDKLKVLGAGFELLPMGGGRYLVQSVPAELSMDHTRVLQLAEDTGCVSREMIIDRLNWHEQRVDGVLVCVSAQCARRTRAGTSGGHGHRMGGRRRRHGHTPVLHCQSVRTDAQRTQ